MHKLVRNEGTKDSFLHGANEVVWKPEMHDCDIMAMKLEAALTPQPENWSQQL